MSPQRVDETPENLAVEPDAATVEIGAFVCEPTVLAMHLREQGIEVVRHPRLLGVGDGHGLDRQRAIRAVVVLADEPIGLQPTSERCFRNVTRGGSPRSPRLVRCHSSLSPDFNVPASRNDPVALAARPPDEVVRRDVERRCPPSCGSAALAFAVRLDRDDRREAVSVENLGADSASRRVADRDQTVRRADQRVVGLARRRLLRHALHADVEPHRAS